MRRNQKAFITLLGLSGIGVMLYFGLGLSLNNLSFFIPFRLKKIVSILLVSFLMAYSSISFQTITHNRLLTPSVMGLDMLYVFLQTLMVFLFKFAIQNELIEFIVSLMLMILMSFVLFKIFFKDQQRNVYFLILSGMVLGTLFSSLSNFLQLMMDPHEFDLLQSKIMASFSSVNPQLLVFSLLLTLVMSGFIFKELENLDVLNLGRDKAINLGVDYTSTVKKHLILISCAIGIVSALVGPLSFLSILVASITRRIVNGYSHQVMILMGTLLSILFLITGLWLVEQVFNHQTTISVLINFIGGLYFISLMLKERQA